MLYAGYIGIGFVTFGLVLGVIDCIREGEIKEALVKVGWISVGWGSDIISENEFVTGIEYLINNNIILLNFVPCNYTIQSQYGDTKSVPDWIKNNAIWWSDNLIDDITFINGLQYLIEHKIIKIDNKDRKSTRLNSSHT